MTMSLAKRVAFGGLFAAASLIFSYVETFIPLDAVTMIPGFKLGLANICIMLAVFYLGAIDGLVITVAKSVLTAVLFGTPISLLFSFCGGLLSYLFLIFAKYVIREKISFIGISVASAALHNVGQVCVAAVLFKDTAVFWYLGWLLPVAVMTGLITGIAAIFFGRFVEKKI